MLRMIAVIIIGIAGLSLDRGLAAPNVTEDCVALLAALRNGEMQRFAQFLERIEKEGNANFDYGPDAPPNPRKTIIDPWSSDESRDEGPDLR